MSKTLSTVLTVFKVLKIITKVVFILCIIGAAGCLLGLAVLLAFKDLIPPELLAEEGLDGASAYLACAAGAIVCVAEGCVAFFAQRYFGRVLNDGTPFTLHGAKTCFRLGVISIIASAAAALVSGLIMGIFILTTTNTSEMEINMSVSISTGLFFMFLSLIFKHGAEVQACVTADCDQDQQTDNT